MRWKEISEGRDWGIYYHGTSASFTGPPEPSISGVYGPGIYLTSDRESALNYGGRGGSASVAAKAYRIAPGKLATDNNLTAALHKASDEGLKRNAKYVRANQMLAEKGYIGIKDGPVVVIFDKKNLTEVTPESASAGATGSASVATVVGGLGAGFDPNGDKGIYQKAPKVKKPLMIRRVPN